MGLYIWQMANFPLQRFRTKDLFSDVLWVIAKISDVLDGEQEKWDFAIKQQ